MKRRDFLAGAVVGVIPGGAAAWNVHSGRTRDREAFDKERAEQPRRPQEARLSFSQQGEDIVLYHALRDTMKIASPTYLDVGAAHPIRSNNTYLLYGTGGTGVLIEPNPAYAKLLREMRPKDKVVEAGIGVTDEEAADYYEIKGAPMLNTFSPEQAEYLKKTGKEVERVTKMPLININKVIGDNLGKTPDLVSTDIEGLDYAVIKSLDMSKYRPAVICAEGVPWAEDNKPSELVTYLTAKGYLVRGGSMVNTIFVDGLKLKTA